MMLGYYVRLALNGIRRSWWSSAIVVAALAVGVGIATSFMTILHLLSHDPLPDKSESVFYVQLDSWSADREYPGRGDDRLPTQLTYQDAVSLARSDVPRAVTVHYRTQVVVRPSAGTTRPFLASARAARADFFEIFDAPFRAGAPWGASEDDGRQAVVVLTRPLKERLFGADDAVGRIVSLADRSFTVVGVLDDWTPAPRHYDMTNGAFQRVEELFIPFSTAVDLELDTTGNLDSWAPQPEGEGLSRFQQVLRSEACWIQMYVELDGGGESKAEFLAYLEEHIRMQKKGGRFGRPLKARLSTIAEVMARWKVVPDVARVLRIVSLMFLSLCILSVVGLLLSVFLSRAHEVGLRRALGASRGAVFTQYMIEAALLGLAGGMMGVVASVGILAWIDSLRPADRVVDFGLTAPMLVVALVMSVASGLLCGVYPAWRVCATPPATHLKA